MELNRDFILEETKKYSPSSPSRSEEDRKLKELPKIFRHESYTSKDLMDSEIEISKIYILLQEKRHRLYTPHNEDSFK